MQITKSFAIAQPLDRVWRALSDIRLVAECLPGAALTEELGADRYMGRFQVKLGPLAASFAGEVAIERRPEECSATVSGKGSDARSGSRASGTMSYRLKPEGAAATRVEVSSTISLAGALAQFGKASVIQEIAGRITESFATNLDRRLAAEAAQREAQDARGRSAAAAPEAVSRPVAAKSESSLDAGRLIWAILRDRVMRLFRRLFGGAPGSRGN